MCGKEWNNIVSRGELAGLQKTEEFRQEPEPNIIAGVLQCMVSAMTTAKKGRHI